MATLTSFLMNWLMLSALYALVAIGFTLIFGVAGAINLAHGAAITVGAFAAFYVNNALGYSIWVGAVAALVTAGVFSFLVYKGIATYLRERPIHTLIATLVVGLIVEEVFLVTAGSTPRAVDSFIPGQVALLGVSMQSSRLLVFALSWVVIGALFAFINYTQAGKALLAISMSDRGAGMVGIESDRMYAYTWFIAGVLAGIAGVFLASFQSVTPHMGRSPLLLSFAIVVLGGVGSIRGSVIGAYLLGLFEVATIVFVSSRLSGLVSFAVLITVLLVRPQGLFGREVGGH